MRKLFTAILLIICSLVLADDLGNPSTTAILKSKGGGGGGGPNTWYDTTTTLDGWFGIAASFMEWDTVTVAQAGNATKLRVKLRGGIADQTVKIALYTSGGSLLGSGTTGTVAASSGEAWYEITFGSSIAVTATTYKVSVCASGVVDVRIQTSGAGKGDFAAQAYAGFPPGTMPASDGQVGSIFVLGIFVN